METFWKYTKPRNINKNKVATFIKLYAAAAAVVVFLSVIITV